MRQRPERPRAIEVAIVIVILVALVLVLNACTITRGTCRTLKEVKTTTACERDGQVIHIEVVPP